MSVLTIKSIHESRIITRLFLILATASVGNSYETVSSFNCFCDTGVKCHGFDIVLKGVNCSSVTDTFNMNRYGAPTKTQNSTASTCVIRYKSPFNSITKLFTEKTRIPTNFSVPANELSCYVGGMSAAAYNASGCEQFGFSLKGSAAPTAVDYYWLVASQVTVGSLVRSPSNVAIPAVTWSVNSVVGANPVASAKINSEDLNDDKQSCELYGDAQCVKIFVTKVETEIEVHDLVDDNPDVPSSYNKTKTKYEWELLQSKPTCDGDYN
jgi:hypothetical protein